MTQPSPDFTLEALREAGKNCLMWSILPLYRAFHGLAQEKYAARGYAGLTTAHTLLFASLDGNGTRIVTLAERMGTSKQFTGRLVHQLVKMGYLTTEPDPLDKRATIVKATSEGVQFFADASAVRDEIEALFRDVIGEERFHLLVIAMQELAAAVIGYGKPESLLSNDNE